MILGSRARSVRGAQRTPHEKKLGDALELLCAPLELSFNCSCAALELLYAPLELNFGTLRTIWPYWAAPKTPEPTYFEYRVGGMRL